MESLKYKLKVTSVYLSFTMIFALVFLFIKDAYILNWYYSINNSEKTIFGTIGYYLLCSLSFVMYPISYYVHLINIRKHFIFILLIILATSSILVLRTKDGFLESKYNQILVRVEYQSEQINPISEFWHPLPEYPKESVLNDAHQELLNGQIHLDPYILYKYTNTEHKSDLFKIDESQQNHLIEMISKSHSERISDAYKKASEDKFISLNEYYSIVRMYNDLKK